MKRKRQETCNNGKANTGSKLSSGYFARMTRTVEHYEPRFPWIIAAAYFVIMGYLMFRYHRIGGLGVETDFYVELVPQAKKLLDGRFSPLNYGAKGPVYSFLLAGTYLIVRDYFYAGLLLNLLSGAVFLCTIYVLIKKVFNFMTSLLVILAVSFNYVFLSYTYQAASDLPFMALCVLSMYFLFRSNNIRDMIFSALWGSLAFLTRYNGAFIVIGSLLYIAAAPDFVRERLKRILLWTAVFVTVGLPWFIPNWIDTGSPVHNDNYMNVMMEYYALGKDGVSYENWTDALPKKFTGMGDIFFYDPVYFLIHMVHNTGEHFLADMKELLGWRLGLAVIVGFILFWFAAPDKKKLVYVSFGVMYFLILTLVFYNVRFSLYLLTCYLPLGVWPFTERKLTGRLKHFLWIPLSIIGFIVLSYVYTTPRIVLAEIKSTPSYLSDLRDLGCALDKIEPDKSKKIIGRKPHVAYFAGLEAVMFPENVTSVEDLVEFCRVNGVDYILYSGIEASLRPHVRVLLNVDQKHPGLEKVYHNRFGVIYRVTGLHEQ